MKTLKLLFAAAFSMAMALTGFGASETVNGVTYFYVTGNEATITGVHPNGYVAITIPATLGGYAVTRIGEAAFSSTNLDAANITSVTIPEGVDWIGEGAFEGCSALKQVYFSGVRPQCEADAFEGVASGAKAYVNTDASGWKSFVGKSWNGLTVVYRTDVGYAYTLEDGRATITGVHPNGQTAITIPSALDGCPVTAIGQYAFDADKRDTANIVSLVIPDGVETIGVYAFHGCDALTSVTIPSSVATIGKYAFYACDVLASVRFAGNAPTTVGFRVFYSIASDAKAYVNCDATGFGPVGLDWNGLEVAYRDDVGFEYTVTNGRVTIVGVTAGSVTGLAIPATLGGWPVTAIGESAFDASEHDTENLTAVKIPEGVTKIDRWAFNTCMSLRSVTFPSSLKTIGQGAFGGCFALAETTIPSGVTTIGDYAFEQCYNLARVYFNGNAPTCGTAAFGGVASNAKAYVNTDASGFGAVGSTWNTFLTVAVRTDVAYEYKSTDNQATITGVHPNGQTEIDVPAELDGYPVTVIGRSAFDTDEWFTGDIVSVTIPEGVTAIREWAFYCCPLLESVTIPASVTTIANGAFYACESLESVYFGGNAPTCAELVFTAVAPGAKAYAGLDATGFGEDGSAWNGLVVLHRGEVTYDYERENGRVSITRIHPNGHTEIVIPSEIDGYPVTAIVDYAAMLETDITSLTIPASVETIGANPFMGCLQLKLTVDPGNDCFCVTNGLLCNKQVTKVISCPGSPTAVKIPASVTAIERSAFSYCTSLGSVTIPEGVETIGEYAFSSCEKLTSVTIPSSVTAIEESAFYYCTSLGSVTIPSSVTAIEKSAFFYCTSLGSVTIPEGVETIGDSAFSSCEKLTSVTIPSSVETIGTGAFAYCTSLESVTIPSSVETIGTGAFAECTSLESVTILEGVETIGDSAFLRCGALTSVTIPEGVETIGEWAFSQCEKLTSVTIPSSVNTIGTGAFYYCRSLESVTIPASVVTIGGQAFGSCSRLVSVYFDGNAPSVGDDAFLNVGIIVESGAKAYVNADATGFGPVGSVWNGLTVASRDDVIVPASVYGRGDLHIPSAWFASFPSFVAKFGADLAAAAVKPTGKTAADGSPMYVWQDYIAGTDPTNPNDVFRVMIEVIDGVAHISWEPNLNADGITRCYRILGKADLAAPEEEWGPARALHRFFKVTVDLPHSDYGDEPGPVVNE